MDLRQLMNAECGQSNPLMQMTTHLTQDRAYQDRTGRSKFKCPNKNFKSPETFKMKDLLQEFSEIKPQEARATQYNNQTAQPHHNQIEQNQISNSSVSVDFERCLSHGLKHLSTQANDCYTQNPPLMYLPQQSHRSGLAVAPQTKEIKEEIKTEIHKFPSYDKTKYKVIKSLDELYENDELFQKVGDESKLSQESRVEMFDQEVEIIDSTYFNFIDGEKITNQHCKSKLRTVLEMGKEYLAMGERTNAILSFEWAIKIDETCVEAYELLGITNIDNVQNVKAIHTLRDALELEPHNLNVLMMLALCYSSYSAIAYCKYESLSFLFSWLKYHPKYKDIIPENFKIKYGTCEEISRSLRAVQNLFMKAALRRSTNIDYEVYGALGILFNLSNEFTKAIDSYQSALQVRPRDARLWNRLGVTFARQNNFKKQLDSYQRALELDPNLVCCHLNIALTYMDKKAYRDAAQHLLIALNLQTYPQNGDIKTDHTSNKVWISFEECLAHMKRSDLMAAADKKNFKKLNKEFGIIENQSF